MKRSSEPTERYLQAVLEIVEDNGRAIRSEIARRTNRHPVTTAELTTRLQDAGLVQIRPDRNIQLTAPGAALALGIVRKHRVIECFLDRVVGLEWALVHPEALRWQHVVSDDVEARMARLLGGPTTSPYGCAVPGMAELLSGRRLCVEAPLSGAADATPGRGASAAEPCSSPISHVVDHLDGGFAVVVVSRITEDLQSDPDVLRRIESAGVVPGAGVVVTRPGRGRPTIRAATRPPLLVDDAIAAGIRVHTAQNAAASIKRYLR